MNPQGNLHITSVDDLLDQIPVTQSDVVHNLKQEILSTLPHISEKVAYNVPFYKLRKNVCFIWPSYIPWGNVPENGVNLGSNRGSKITDPFGLLNIQGRKSVATITFFDSSEIDRNALRYYLFEAAELDNKL